LRNYTGEMPGLADYGYEDAGRSILIPVKKLKGMKELDINTRTRNMLLISASRLGKEASCCFLSAGRRPRMSLRARVR